MLLLPGCNRQVGSHSSSSSLACCLSVRSGLKRLLDESIDQGLEASMVQSASRARRLLLCGGMCGCVARVSAAAVLGCACLWAAASSASAISLMHPSTKTPIRSREIDGIPRGHMRLDTIEWLLNDAAMDCRWSVVTQQARWACALALSWRLLLLAFVKRRAMTPKKLAEQPTPVTK
jgi:hypothetical protein